MFDAYRDNVGYLSVRDFVMQEEKNDASSDI
jgi:hypothetical protein